MPRIQRIRARLRRSVFRRARRLLGNDADAHEVVQDLFVSLFERPEQFSQRSTLTTFLYSATTHACLNRIRNKKRRLQLLATSDPSPGAESLPRGQPRLQRQKASVIRPPLRAASACGVLLAAAATFAAAAVLVLSLRTSTVEPSIRTKGGAALGFFVKHGDRVRPSICLRALLSFRRLHSTS
jgi:hypothetical protein